MTTATEPTTEAPEQEATESDVMKAAHQNGHDATPQNGDRHDFDAFERLNRYVVDTRRTAPDMFVDVTATNWSELTWDEVNRPYKVEKWARAKKQYEAEHAEPLPIQEGWRMFNESFQHFFDVDPKAEGKKARGDMLKALARLDLHEAGEAWEQFLAMKLWNNVHRAEDAVWDPRGKRALFGGLDVKKPRILFLGAADGYEAMQLYSMYPGGEAVLVDYDEYCKEGRFGAFPEAYPFVGSNPETGNDRIWYKEEMDIVFEVEDIRNLKYGKEFDLVVSIGLIEHFPDEYKPLAFEAHRNFLKPGGYAIMTTPRNQFRSRAFYNMMSNFMNFGYRELMDINQLGMYAYENGFDILRAGVIKAHNGLICQPR